MNEVFVMKGGNPLRGDVVISGAKNAALGIVAGALLTDEEVIIENLPDVRDINVMLEALKAIGAKVHRIESHVVSIQADQLSMKSVDDDAIRRIRASYYFIGALLGKYHQAKVALPGGCAIGERPIDQHIKGFTALGAEVEISDGYFVAKAEELVGQHIYLDVVSVGATINLMLAAVLADGQTIIENVAKEPHIVDVANFLNSMGANIRGAGTDTIRIRGVERLHGTTYGVIPDQIEAGTFMCAAAVTRGNILIKNIIPKHMESIAAKLRDMGNTVYEGDEEIQVIGGEKQRGTKIKTLPYPGFPTDMQPQIAVTLALAEGKSTVTESIFENRFLYVEELKKMGADITVEDRVATILGQEKLQGATLHALDLRAGAALVLAGLAAEGVTVLEDIGYIRRGYEFFEKKLMNLGAKIILAKTEEEVEAFRREA
ncbi:UDP-N-acetylglucosamine 1-carboxyvinyltransferase [Oribacterium sinus]|uniref:UDP-N-acetylglucosamine 1-carboxyvinyltransferase n=1 Tax=Oribacterium sinus F0268 TaxID=585501 RepID=C2L0K1_9FIRM|nr:UDP-N-acetylglucosamine 1-carboxyvinyltransferase [Oribacterium sinus]EEJ50461.1 UDP-N-acetylglucosamine 1-carboxyvinyltransferase [Oribacterium sinus F0268]